MDDKLDICHEAALGRQCVGSTLDDKAGQADR